jgi:hypothetical protein
LRPKHITLFTSHHMKNQSREKKTSSTAVSCPAAPAQNSIQDLLLTQNPYNNDPLQKYLLLSKTLIFDKCSLNVTAVVPEPNYGIEYGACRFKINDANVIFRIAKITPKKIGQFVTCWKRSSEGLTTPYDSTDPVDILIVCTKNDDHFGQFVFPKSTLMEQNIFSTNNNSGKLGFRVYPPWDTPINTQAKRTQIWQLKYFIDSSKDIPLK